MELKKTPFYQKHLENKGRIVDFAGWALVVEYKSMLGEAKAVRKACGIFDASHMGQIIIRGNGAIDFLQKLSCNDISAIAKGQMQYNLILNEAAGVIDDLMVYHLGDSLLCVVNASNKDKVFEWFKQNLDDNVEISDESDKICLLSVQGSCSEQIISKVFGREFAKLEYLRFEKKQVDGKEVLISRSGYTGEDGFEIYLEWSEGVYFWDKIVKVGKEFDLVLCGIGSRDILRTEAGYPLYGHEINEEITPLQACLGWAVKFNKDFIGKNVLLKEKNNGTSRERIGFIMQEKAFPRQSYPIYFREKEIGFVTSGVYSPNRDAFIGMAYVEKNCTDLNNEIDIDVRGKLCKAKIVKLPFISSKTKKAKQVVNGS